MESTSCARLYWPFSLEVYLSPGTSEICLQFQDELGVDVNVFLLCLLGSKLKKKAFEPNGNTAVGCARQALERGGCKGAKSNSSAFEKRSKACAYTAYKQIARRSEAPGVRGRKNSAGGNCQGNRRYFKPATGRRATGNVPYQLARLI